MNDRTFIDYYISLTHAVYMLNTDLQNISDTRVIYVGHNLYDYIMVNRRFDNKSFKNIKKHIIRLNENLSNYNYIIDDSNAVINNINEI